MRTLLSPYGVAVIWAPLGLSIALVASIAAIHRLGRGRRWLLPSGWGRRMASAALLALVLLSAKALVSMAPVSHRLFTLHAGAGTRVPDIPFRMVADGTLHHFAEFKGKVVILNIWATWCPSCRHELPAFNRLQAAYADRGLVVLNLSDEPRESLVEFAKTQRFDTVSGCVDSFEWEWFNPGNMRPFTLIIDRDGYYREMALSGEVTYEQLDARVGDYL